LSRNIFNSTFLNIADKLKALQIVELSHSHATWLLVDTKSKIPLLNHHNRIETTVSTYARKRHHKRLRIASAVVLNLFYISYPFIEQDYQIYTQW